MLHILVLCAEIIAGWFALSFVVAGGFYSCMHELRRRNARFFVVSIDLEPSMTAPVE